ncbi:hypothetical protein C5167_000080 [Papaver somniferum]|uniref:non-specific serine/threonine protein kinase n=1 Tax=Papaver somniferum TaxID=3469 RepID=A0A4Y7KT01_PAPSO|nr:L-type lectin-domain containing receptor kinase IV.1-like [Papaver somniferum]RZC75917.1 hypothetical protein C5167_000080 [Papaver somniferum]
MRTVAKGEFTKMWTLFFNLVSILFLLFVECKADFVYNGLEDAYLTFDGAAQVADNGLLSLTDQNNRYEIGHAFFSGPFQFKNNVSSTPVSFSTTFVVAITSEYGSNLSDQGMAFVIAPQRGLPGAQANQYLGLFNDSNNGKSTNHVLAVELDTVYNVEFDTVRGPHVGIDIDHLFSVNSTSPAYTTNGKSKKLNIISGEPIQVWIEYDGIDKELRVTLAPINVSKPNVPLLSLSRDLSNLFLSSSMYVGFSASTQTVLTSHYILGWSFTIDGKARPLNLSDLPQLPQPLQQPPEPPQPKKKKKMNLLLIVVPIIIVLTVLALLISICVYYKRRRNRKHMEAPPAELVPEPREMINNARELNNWPRNFSYNELKEATKGFSEEEDIGRGGFGTVYRGVLPNSKLQVAIKKVSCDARQGSKQFLAEIASIGKLRHRNLVTLFGYCVHEGQLLLVYEFMPNLSLDKFLYPKRGSLSSNLDWSKRFHIIEGTASGLYYLHQGWEQVVIHRDIKSSNILLDAQMNARIGDFGLAKLYDHGAGSGPTSRVVGTPGYIAPEMPQIGIPSTETDVYAFGAFLLEVVTGRRPNLVVERGLGLVSWVLSCMKENAILNAVDPRLGGEYVVQEMVLVLKLGLLCCHNDPASRPSMFKVMKLLDGDANLRSLDRSDDAPSDFGTAVRESPSPLSSVNTASTFSASEASPSGIREVVTY